MEKFGGAGMEIRPIDFCDEEAYRSFLASFKMMIILLLLLRRRAKSLILRCL